MEQNRVPNPRPPVVHADVHAPRDTTSHRATKRRHANTEGVPGIPVAFGELDQLHRDVLQDLLDTLLDRLGQQAGRPVHFLRDAADREAGAGDETGHQGGGEGACQGPEDGVYEEDDLDEHRVGALFHVQGQFAEAAGEFVDGFFQLGQGFHEFVDEVAEAFSHPFADRALHRADLRADALAQVPDQSTEDFVGIAQGAGLVWADPGDLRAGDQDHQGLVLGVELDGHRRGPQAVRRRCGATSRSVRSAPGIGTRAPLVSWPVRQ
ncbi:hypothetical protein HNR67_004712 [Crossiella cryophila]|uniref:Uncharacterized protein n=1 Tax=Crossiella cryophila TaxID=43355 RepID=A0A7W7FX63_9PSEU|nr:hypothetical protein [Crossiella cryophila]MBB4678594.1 hypothetical protein [Crossiella cryophila]